MPERMPEPIPDKKREKNPEMQPQQSEHEAPHREKEISIADGSRHQSTAEPAVEKGSPRRRGTEVQNPLLHESY